LKEAFDHYNIKFTDDEINDIFKKYDKSLDSLISFEEFRQMMEEKS